MTARIVELGGCRVVHTDWGGLARLDVDGLSMVQYPAHRAEPGAGGLWLRILRGADATAIRLAHPAADNLLTTFADGFMLTGRTLGLDYSCRFSLHPQQLAWQWLVSVENHADEAVEVDLVMAADVALAPYDIVRINQFYVSQYLDLSPLHHDRWGQCLAVRQNMPGPRAPWVLLGSYGGGVGWATDAFQLAPDNAGELSGLSRRMLPDERLQHEHTLAVIADTPVTLQPGQSHRTGFFGRLVPDHPAATEPDDVRFAPDEPFGVATEPTAAAHPVPPATLFAHASQVSCDPVDPDDLAHLAGAQVRVVEQPDADWWEALSASGEVLVSAAKERAVRRPHGHLLRTGPALTPDPGCLTSTVWMRGVFGSQLTRGHVGRHPMLTTTQGYLGLSRSQGLRVFVQRGEDWLLLGQPSVWGLHPDRARWWYAFEDVLLQVTSAASGTADELTVEVEVLRGDIGRVLAAAQLAEDGSPAPQLSVTGGSMRADWPAGWLSVDVTGGSPQLGADGPLFADGRDRGLPWLSVSAEAPLRLVLRAGPASGSSEPAGTVSTGTLSADRFSLRPTQDGAASAELAELNRILPWFTQNAMVHYLSPRGLEQFTGGGWGTRDVCQGPVGLLIAYGEDDALRDVLLRVLQAQHDRGDWPQSFDFLPPIPPGQTDSHGDVVFWPLLAVGDYLVHTHDATLLAETAGFVGAEGPAPSASVREHLDRALAVIEQRTVPGRPLPAYGHGDWNDSLQPADPRLAAQMASAWTAVLQVQTLRTLAEGLRVVADDSGIADRAALLADATEQALLSDLLVDGLLAGYGVYDQGAAQELLVHPRDTRTGLHYGVLPWIHAISAELLDPAAAQDQLRALQTHLLGPDGARLFDRPTPYRGGPMHVFQRAEAATFWGREIGLMYTHAHLRYAEALAKVGDAQGLLHALCQVNPIGITGRVPSATARQSTCYYSSSDAGFADRYDAERNYRGSLTGDVPLHGGWRVYSSGPGLFLRLVVECLLGVSRRGGSLLLDPVLDPALGGLSARVAVGERTLELEYRIAAPGYGVRSVSLDGRQLPLQPQRNRYRPAGVLIDSADLPAGAAVTRLLVEVGDAEPGDA